MKTIRVLFPLLLLHCAAPPKPPPSSAPDTPAPEAPSDDEPRIGTAVMDPPPVRSAEEAQANLDAVLQAVREQPGARRVVTLVESGEALVLWHWQEPGLILSEEICAPGGEIGSCMALDAIREIQTVAVETGPGNPASYFCAPARGRPVAAQSKSGASELCAFPDGSYLASWSLIYAPALGHKIRAQEAAE